MIFLELSIKSKYSLSVEVCCSEQQKVVLLFQAHQSCNPLSVQDFWAQRTHHITIHNSKIFSIAISISSLYSKVYNLAWKVHARLKFILHYFLFCYRIISLVVGNRQDCFCVNKVHKESNACKQLYQATCLWELIVLLLKIAVSWAGWPKWSHFLQCTFLWMEFVTAQ